MKDFFKESDFCATETKVGFDRHSNYPRYACEIANRLIRERGKVVRAIKLNSSGLTDEHGAGWLAQEESVQHTSHFTHTAFLLNIESIKPIEQDSAEGLLKEFVDFFSVKGDTVSFTFTPQQTKQLCDRARKLLEREKKGE